MSKKETNMAVYFQFKSSTVKESLPIDGLFITVGELRLNILEKITLRRNRSSDSDIILSNYETKEDYVDDGTLIPRHATVWIRQVPNDPSVPLKPIIANPPPVPVEPEVVKIDPEDFEWEELVNVINGTETLSSISRNSAPDEMDEDSKIKALVEKLALDWQNGSGGFVRETPHPGYVCYRCKIPGHFIKHCPTNGDPEYDDFKRVRRPRGIPKSMLVATPDGSYALPTGEAAELKPNEAAFERAMEGVPSSSRSVGQLPPELHCRLCKQVMKDAVLTSRCCFDSFCDRCIRNHIITKLSCVCGATNVLADDLIPNLTLRGTINRILESSSNSSSGGQVLPVKQESVSVKESAPAASQESGPLPDVEVEKKSVKESAPTATQSIGRLPDVEVEKKPVSDKTAEKKPVSDKTAEKKALPLVTPYENYMMSMGYNPYWGAMQPVAYNTCYGPYAFGPMNMAYGVEQNMMNSGFNAGRPHEVRRGNEKRKRDDEKFSSKAASRSDHIQQPRSDDRSRDHREHSRWSRSHHHQHSESAEKEEGALKKRKLSSSSKGCHESRATSVSSRKSVADDERSDDDDDERHFKRRPSWYKSSPPAMMKRGRQERSRSRDGGRFQEGDRIGGRALVA